MKRRRLDDDGGQATVELAVVLPVVIIVAVIAVNALTFFGACAAFDRFKNFMERGKVFKQLVNEL